MKNKNLLIIVIVLALVLIGGYFWFAQTDPEVGNINDQEMNEEMNEEMGEDMDMEESMEDMIADERTVMAMNGKFTPEVLHVSAGQEMRILNHEEEDLTLLFSSDVEIGPITAGNEGLFLAPTGPGSFEYRSSLDESVVFTIVVEI